MKTPMLKDKTEMGPVWMWDILIGIGIFYIIVFASYIVYVVTEAI